MTSQEAFAEMQVELLRLRAENSALKQKGNIIKVSTKGAVSVYGFGRWPVTLYKSQWEKLFDMVDEVKAFIQANNSKLSVKVAAED